MEKGFKKIKFSLKYKIKKKKKNHLEKEFIIILKLIIKLSFLIFVSFIFLFGYIKINFPTNYSKYNNSKNYADNIMNISSFIDPVEELTNIKQYIKDVFNLSYLDKDKIFYPTDNPLISIIISVYNGEGFLNRALVSIQNQDLKDIK